MTRTALYRCFDATGALVYIGVSDKPEDRLKQHAANSPWHRYVAVTAEEWCDSRDDAFVKERQAIAAEKPLFNVQSNGPKAASDIRSLINHWPRRSEFAAAVGVPVASVHKWADTGRIPTRFMGATVDAAQEKGLTFATAEWMINAHARPSTAGAA